MDYQFVDITILLVSATACLYCIILSQRLKKLQNLENGIGASIKSMSETISLLKVTTEDGGQHASQKADELAKLLRDANQMCDRIEVLSDTLETNHQKTSHQINNAQEELSAVMRSLLEESKDQVVELTQIMREIKSHSDAMTKRSLFKVDT